METISSDSSCSSSQPVLVDSSQSSQATQNASNNANNGNVAAVQVDSSPQAATNNSNSNSNMNQDDDQHGAARAVTAAEMREAAAAVKFSATAPWFEYATGDAGVTDPKIIICTARTFVCGLQSGCFYAGCIFCQTRLQACTINGGCKLEYCPRCRANGWSHWTGPAEDDVFTFPPARAIPMLSHLEALKMPKPTSHKRV